MARPERAYSRTVRQAAALLGAYVREARVERGWSQGELASRAGVTVKTLVKVERGDPSVTLGVAFDVANLVGVPLFVDDPSRLARELATRRDRIALLPQRVRKRGDDVDTDF